MRTKDKSVIFDLSSKMIEALPIIDAVYLHYGQIAVITSAKDGVHMKLSKHHSEEGDNRPSDAVDTRTRYFDKETKIKVAGRLQSHLGDSFDVVLEHTHIHIEHDPK